MIPYAYVTGTFYSADGVARSNQRITFQPLSTPYAVDGEVVLSVPQSVQLDSQGRIHDGNGNLRYKLAKGFYRVIASDTDAFNIEVPDDQANHEVASLTSQVSPAPVIGVQQILTPNDLFNVVEDSELIRWSNTGQLNGSNKRIAFIGEVGLVSDEDYFYRWAAESNVWPQFILGNANPGGLSSTIEASMYQWRQFIENSNAHVFYALGTEDYTQPSEVDDSMLYLDSLTPTRYFKVSTGTEEAPTDVFVMDSNDETPDSNTANSTQALWLRDQLALSTARWKIVCFNAPPVCSVTGRANSAMNWPFKAWGADLVVAGGAKSSEYWVLGDGTKLVVIGTSGKGPYDGMTNQIFSFGQNTRRQALIVDIAVSRLTVIFANVPNGSRWAQIVIQGKTDQRLVADLDIAWDSGLTRHSPDGSGLRFEPWGTANFKQSVGRFAESVISPSYGHVIRMASVPTPDMVRANPLLKSSLVLVPEESAFFSMYAWVPAYNQFALALTSVVDNVNIEPATEQLASPILSYDNANSALGVLISHDVNGVDIWVSVNFAPFVLLQSWPSLVLFDDPKPDTPSVIAAFAAKDGYMDSEIVSRAFAQANKMTITPEGPGGL